MSAITKEKLPFSLGAVYSKQLEDGSEAWFFASRVKGHIGKNVTIHKRQNNKNNIIKLCDNTREAKKFLEEL